jgi:hypothetical protein
MGGYRKSQKALVCKEAVQSHTQHVRIGRIRRYRRFPYEAMTFG